MAYYCRKCKRWHTGGKIARAHTVFSARPPRTTFRPQTTRKKQKREIKRQPRRKIIRNKPELVITRKKKPVKVKPQPKFLKARKPSIGISKHRRGQIRMKTYDVHEKKMLQRLRDKTGMTHVQIMNLVHLAKKNDYLDIETEIMGASGLSRDRTETYEFAKKRIMKKLERSGDIMITSKYSDPDYFDEMQNDWLERERRRKKAKKMMDLI